MMFKRHFKNLKHLIKNCNFSLNTHLLMVKNRKEDFKSSSFMVTLWATGQARQDRRGPLIKTDPMQMKSY